MIKKKYKPLQLWNPRVNTTNADYEKSLKYLQRQHPYSYSFSAALRQAWEGKQATPNGPLSKLKTQRQRLYGPAMQIPIGLPELSPITATSRQVSTSKTNRVTEVTITNKLFPNAVIDVSGRCGWTVYEVPPHGITETEEKQLHRLLSKHVKEWKAKINALIPTDRLWTSTIRDR